MNLHERVLSVMGCKHVDDVLIDAPRIITPEMIHSLKIDEVVYGKTMTDNVGDDVNTGSNLEERYKVAIEAGIFNEITANVEFNLSSILDRIQVNQKVFQSRFAKKNKAEQDYYDNKNKAIATEN